MALTPGSRLGPYEVVGSIGAGGMGEVYRARDARLDRDVALKILPASFAADPDRLARFEREAKTLASLNHPHIAQIYGVEDGPAAAPGSTRTRALVMELVEGEDLSQRIARGAIPLDDALPIAKQIAAALEAAHDLGIIHRDLKPANVKLRPDGTVKVLDFGLAKALDRTDVSGISPALANSPTITTPAMTQAGMILGTAAYMSPEQAKGRVVDRRTDLWAFGCVLFEMLTGKRAFAGDDVTDTLTAIFRDEPRWAALPADTPASVRTLLRRCLQKDRARRLDSAAMARIELDEPVAADASPVGKRRTASPWLWVFGTATAAALIVSAFALTRPLPDTDAPVIRFSVPLPNNLGFRIPPWGVGLVLSPDGRNIVYTSGVQGTLVRRRLDAEHFDVLKEPGIAPFFSPDSKWLAFFADGRLKKMPVEGGLATTICNTDVGRGTWGDDGSIVFATTAGLFRVPSSGGTPTRVAPVIQANALGIPQPVYLPGSRAVIVPTRIDGNPRIQAVTLADGVYHDLVAGLNPVSADDRQLVFVRDNQLWSAPLDMERLTVVGAPAPVLDGFRMRGPFPILGVAKNGTVAYMPAESVTRSTVVWMDRKGQTTQALPETGGYLDPRLSPDGGRVAVSMSNPDGGADVWVFDLNRRTKLRLTTAGLNLRPRWTPDGVRVSFSSENDLYQRRADGSGDREPVLVRPDSQFLDAWAPDGTTLIYNEGAGVRDLWSVRIGAEPVRLVPASPFTERAGSVSPDGKWLVFTSDESGRDEIYVQAFPGPGPKVAISSDGGIQPAWSRDGRELFYRHDDVMMVVPVAGDPRKAGTPQRLFDFPAVVYGVDQNRVEYDVGFDGRLLAVRSDDRTGGQEIRVVTNWLADRTRAAATTRP